MGKILLVKKNTPHTHTHAHTHTHTTHTLILKILKVLVKATSSNFKRKKYDFQVSSLNKF